MSEQRWTDIAKKVVPQSEITDTVHGEIYF